MSRHDLSRISKRDWDILEKTGMLWELYPEAPSTWYELDKKDNMVFKNKEMQRKRLQVKGRA
jgi:hypothetical protein